MLQIPTYESVKDIEPIIDVDDELQQALILMDTFTDEPNNDDEVERDLTEALHMLNAYYKHPLLLENNEISYEASAAGRTHGGLRSWLREKATQLALKSVPFIMQKATQAINAIDELSAEISSLIKNKLTFDNFINKRFDSLDKKIEKYEEYQTGNIYVNRAPTYEECADRLVGLLAVTENLLSMARESAITELKDDQLFENMAIVSNGVFKVTSPKAGSVIKKLTWTPPEYKSFDFRRSKWYDKNSRDTIRKATIQLKTVGCKNLLEASSVLKKTCRSVTMDVSKFRGNDDYSSSYEDSSSGLEKITKTYAVSYLVNKLIRQTLRMIIREVNTMVIINISRLTSFNKVGM